MSCLGFSDDQGLARIYTDDTDQEQGWQEQGDRAVSLGRRFREGDFIDGWWTVSYVENSD